MVPPVGDMLVVGGLCRRMLLRDDATCGAGKVHRLLRVPPTGCRRTFYREHPIVDRTLLRFGVAHAPLVERSLRPSRPSFARCWRLFRQINQTRQEAAFCRPCKPLAFASADPSFGGPGRLHRPTQASAGQDGRRSAQARCPGLGERRRIARPSHGAPFWLVVRACVRTLPLERNEVQRPCRK